MLIYNTEARDLAKANAAAIVSMEKHIYNVEGKCNVLTAKTIGLLKCRNHRTLTVVGRT